MPKVVDGIERKTPEELEALAKQAKSEVVKEKASKPKVLKTEGAAPLETNVGGIQSVGAFQAELAKPDSAMQKVFKKIAVERKGWVKMSDEDVIEYQKQGVLIGHDPESGLGLLRKE